MIQPGAAPQGRGVKHKRGSVLAELRQRTAPYLPSVADSAARAAAVVPLEVALSGSAEADACAILTKCSDGLNKEAAELILALRDKDAEAFQSTLYGGIFLPLLQAPHQRPLAAASALRGIADVVSKLGGDSAEAAVRWLLVAGGGRGCDASDTGVRWRSCALLGSFLKALRELAGGSTLPVDLQADVGDILLARARDRNADVRLVAVEGLGAVALRVDSAADVLVERAMSDCSEHVRAAAVRALVVHGSSPPQDIVVRARLDVSPRVRRALLQAMMLKVLQGGEEWATVWPATVLHAVGDRSRAVRFAAARCLLAATQRGWPGRLLADAELAERSAGRLAGALTWLRRQDPESEHLQTLLAPEPALEQLAPGGSLERVLFARVAAASAAALGEAPPGGGLPRLILEALKKSSRLEVRQLLLITRVAELPPHSAGRAAVAHAAAAVLKAVQVGPLAEDLLRDGAFPQVRLGAAAEAVPNPMLLAMLLLRSVSRDRAGCAGGAAAAGARELWVSRLTAAVYDGVRRARDEAEERVSELGEEAASAREDLEEARWALESRQSRGSVAEALRARCGQIEDTARAMGEALASAEERRDELRLRTVLIATAWLQQSRAPFARDAAQSGLLDTTLRSAVRAPSGDHATQVAALMGIAVFATKSAEHAESHWPFFMGLLEAQLPSLRDPISGLADSAPLRVAARLAEIAVLFLTDALLLHGGTLGEGYTPDLFLALARVLVSVDMASAASCVSSDQTHLRAVICDRTCCLTMMGHHFHGGAAAKWMLGRLLGEVCGVGHSLAAGAQPDRGGDEPRGLSTSRGAGDEGGPDVVARAVGCGRLLHFFGTLPLLTPAHAEAFVQAAETFFGARLWMLDSQPHSSSARATPLSRVARLACRRLGLAAAALERMGVVPATLQLRVVRAAAAALLAAPALQAAMLRDALATSVLAAAGGGHPLAWAGQEEAPGLAAALGALLHGWAPTTTARSVMALLGEVRAADKEAEAGWQWAQEALDQAADLRHDLSGLGLGFASGLGMPHAPVTQRRSSGGDPAANRSTREPRRKVQPVSVWQIVDAVSLEAKVIPGGGKVVLGRHTACDVVVKGAAVSSKHCSIECSGEGLRLRDLSSANGTYVNGEPMERGGTVDLKDGDAVALAANLGPRFSVRAGTPWVAGAANRGTSAPLTRKRSAPQEAGPSRGDGGSQGRAAGHATLDRQASPGALTRAAKAPRAAAASQPPHQLLAPEPPALAPAPKLREAPGSVKPVSPEPPRQTEAHGEDAGVPESDDAGVQGSAPSDHTTPPHRPRRRLSTKTRDPTASVMGVVGGGASALMAPVQNTDSQDANAGKAQDVSSYEPNFEHDLEQKPSNLSSWELVVVETGKRVAVPQRGEIVLGRRPDCDLALDSVCVSGRHCMISSAEGKVKVEDLGSANGTYLGGVRLLGHAPVEIKESQVLALAGERGPLVMLESVSSSGKRKRPDPADDESSHRLCKQRRRLETPDEDKDEEEGEAEETAGAVAKLPLAAAGVVGDCDSSVPCLVDGISGRVHTLPNEGEVSVGRHEGCHIVIQEPTVSSRHCILKCTSACAEIEDVSANGTYVNGNPVPKRLDTQQGEAQSFIVLSDGDEIVLANSLTGPKLIFRQLPASERDASLAAAGA